MISTLHDRRTGLLIYDVIHVYDVAPMILKPVSEEKLFSALDKAIKRIASNNGETLLITFSPSENVTMEA